MANYGIIWSDRDGASAGIRCPIGYIARQGATSTLGAMNVRPLRDHLIVQRVEHTGDSAAATVPDSAEREYRQGKVLAAGSGTVDAHGVRVPLDVKTGDTILFGKDSAQEITVDGVDYLIVKAGHVLAIPPAVLGRIPDATPPAADGGRI
jgi:chaperonin GroES